MLTRSQVITAGMGSIVGISIPAVKIVMDLYGVRNQKECLEKVIRLFHAVEAERKQREGN